MPSKSKVRPPGAGQAHSNTPSITWWLVLTGCVVAGAVAVSVSRGSSAVILSATSSEKNIYYVKNVSCMTPLIFHQNNCARIVLDNLFHAEDVLALKALAEKGMDVRPSIGGPTILDLNTGYLRDTDGLINLFNDDSYADVITTADFDLYRRIIGKLKRSVEASFGLGPDAIYFTAPTFITRLDGRKSWNPKGKLVCEVWLYIY